MSSSDYSSRPLPLPNRSLPVRAYDTFAAVFNWGQGPLMFLMRLYIGYQAIISGYGHLTHFQQTVKAFQGWNIPYPAFNVGLAGTTEIVGGGLFILGFAARLVAVPMTINFIVAILSVNLASPKYHHALMNIWQNQDVVLKDDAFPFLALSVLVLFYGPGWFSIDALLKRNVFHKHELT